MNKIPNNQGPDFDEMSSFFPCKIDDEIQFSSFTEFSRYLFFFLK